MPALFPIASIQEFPSIESDHAHSDKLKNGLVGQKNPIKQHKTQKHPFIQISLNVLKPS